MMVTLPSDADERAKKFDRLTEATKKQLLDSVRQQEPKEQAKALEKILRQSDVSSEFFQFILKESTPLVPNNKRANSLHTK